jgi:hypothetical protein
MLFKMDNIFYTCIAPLIVCIFFGEIRYCHTLYVSNTKLIMRQSDQIQFLLTRIIELDKKIKKLNLDITQEEKELDCLQEEEKLDCLQEEKLDCLQEEKLDCLQEEKSDCLQEEKLDCLQEEKSDCLQEEKLDCLQESPCLEKDFELVEPSSTYKISKNNGWLRFIF